MSWHAPNVPYGEKRKGGNDEDVVLSRNLRLNESAD